MYLVLVRGKTHHVLRLRVFVTCYFLINLVVLLAVDCVAVFVVLFFF